MNERIDSNALSDLKITFKSPTTAKSVEKLITAHLFTGSKIKKIIKQFLKSLDVDVNVENSFDPLPLYSPPIPSYEEVTHSRRSTSEPSK